MEEFKQLPGARIRLDTQNNTEAAHTGLQSKPVFVRTRANPWGPTNTENADTNGVDDDSLKQFAKLKYGGLAHGGSTATRSLYV